MSLDQRHSPADSGVGCTSDNRGLSLGWGSALHDPRPRWDLRHRRHTPIAHHGHSRQAHCTSLTLAERLCRTADRIDPARVVGSRQCFGRGTSAPNSEKLCGLLQWRENASVSKQRCGGLSAGSAIRRHQFTRPLGRTSSPLRSGLSFRYTQGSSLLAVGSFGLATAINYSLSGLVDWRIACEFIAGGIVGGLAGMMLANRLSHGKDTLKRIFAGLIFIVAAYVLYRSRQTMMS